MKEQNITRAYAIRMLLSFEAHSHKELKQITGWESLRLSKVLQYMEKQGHIDRANRKWNLTLKGFESLKRKSGTEDLNKRFESLEELRRFLGGYKPLMTLNVSEVD